MHAHLVGVRLARLAFTARKEDGRVIRVDSDDKGVSDVRVVEQVVGIGLTEVRGRKEHNGLAEAGIHSVAGALDLAAPVGNDGPWADEAGLIGNIFFVVIDKFLARDEPVARREWVAAFDDSGLRRISHDVVVADFGDVRGGETCGIKLNKGLGVHGVGRHLGQGGLPVLSQVIGAFRAVRGADQSLGDWCVSRHKRLVALGLHADGLSGLAREKSGCGAGKSHAFV